MDIKEIRNMLLEAFIVGVIWAVMFYYIRKGLNKRNFMVDNPNERREDFKWDAIYGGLAAAFATIVKKMSNNVLAKLL